VSVLYFERTFPPRHRDESSMFRATVDELVREFVTDSLSAETQIFNETAGNLDARLGKRKIG